MNLMPLIVTGALLLSACAAPIAVPPPADKAAVFQDESAYVTGGDQAYEGFSLDHVLHSDRHADIHYNLYVPEDYDGSPLEVEETRILVAYFSATGNTETVAGYLAEALSADTYAITSETSYTSDDLNWRDESSRSVQEHNDPSLRPAISGSVENMDEYDVIFLGYPLWWGDAPLIVRTFLESYDLTGKTIVPFCTSSSSAFGDSGKNLEEFAPDALWQDGERFTGRSTQDDVAEWLKTLDLNA